MSRTEIDIMAGRCLVELGEPLAAAPLLASAISGYRPEHAREVALYRTWLAEAYLEAGEVDAARETLTLARRSSATVNSARLAGRISAVESLVDPA